MADEKPTSPLVYLKKELGFVLSEWSSMEKKDQEEMREWAIKEMKVRQIPCTVE